MSIPVTLSVTEVSMPVSTEGKTAASFPVDIFPSDIIEINIKNSSPGQITDNLKTTSGRDNLEMIVSRERNINITPHSYAETSLDFNIKNSQAGTIAKDMLIGNRVTIVSGLDSNQISGYMVDSHQFQSEIMEELRLTAGLDSAVWPNPSSTFGANSDFSLRRTGDTSSRFLRLANIQYTIKGDSPNRAGALLGNATSVNYWSITNDNAVLYDNAYLRPSNFEKITDLNILVGTDYTSNINPNTYLPTTTNYEIFTQKQINSGKLYDDTTRIKSIQSKVVDFNTIGDSSHGLSTVNNKLNTLQVLISKDFSTYASISAASKLIEFDTLGTDKLGYYNRDSLETFEHIYGRKGTFISGNDPRLLSEGGAASGGGGGGAASGPVQSWGS